MAAVLVGRRGCRSAYQTRGGGAPVESPVPARRAALRRSSTAAWGSRSCPAAAGIGTGCGCGSLRGASGRRRRLERRGRRWRRREVELRASLRRQALQRFISLTVQYKIPLLVLGSSSSQPFSSSQESSMWDFDEDPLTHQPLPPRLLEGPWDGRKRGVRRAGARGGHRHADGGPGVRGDDGERGRGQFRARRAASHRAQAGAPGKPAQFTKDPRLRRAPPPPTGSGISTPLSSCAQ